MTSSISMYIPTLQINKDELQNFVRYIYKHQPLLKGFGAIKIQPSSDCKFSLKKRRKHVTSCANRERVVKISGAEPIYSVHMMDTTGKSVEPSSVGTDEGSFWSSLYGCGPKGQRMNVSILPNKSFFREKTSRTYFDIHRVPNQSLLRLCGTKVTRQFVPRVWRAHGRGAVFSLSAAQQHLFSVNYHHEGGAHHWYIIPSRERGFLRRIIEDQKLSACLDHGQLLIDPTVLDRYRICYHRIIQYPNEFLVFSAGTLAQGFAEGASWSESIDFALPSWIEEGHASASMFMCQCGVGDDFLSEMIDLTLFEHDMIRRYITTYLNDSNDDDALSSKPGLYQYF